MYSLSIFFGPSPVPAQFLFKDIEKAKTAYNTYVDFKASSAINGILIGADDYGQAFAIDFEDIHAVILEDMDLGEESRIQRGLSQARGQAKANERAKNDPMLRAMMNSQGPAILSPGGFGRN